MPTDEIRYRDEAKKAVSLCQIQDRYFQILDANFGEIHRQMVAAGADPNVAGHLAARDAEFVAHFIQNIGGLISDVEGFWRDVGDSAVFHLQDAQSLKAVFGGDLFPSFTKNIASTAGLYVDTIILPCPIVRSSKLVRMWKPEKATYYIVKNALNALGYRDLALSDVVPPIVAIVPDLELLDEHHLNTVSAFAKPAAVRHASRLFEIEFTSIEEVEEFLTRFPLAGDVLARLKNSKRFVVDVDSPGSVADQLGQLISGNEKQYDSQPGEGHAGRAVLWHCFGRMMQAASIELRSSRLHGTPLIDAETSWQHLNWKMEYDAGLTLEFDHPNEAMHVVHALQAEADKNLQWLGNVPPASIVEIRKRGLSEEVRGILSQGVLKLVDANPSNFFRTSDQVVANIDQALEAHQAGLLDARNKKLRLFGLDVPACLAWGGISIAAAVKASPALGAVAGALGIAGLANLREIKTKYLDLRQEEEKIRNSPTALLFKHLP